eukprot:1161300-Pelagomonas_calceolata.AAC.6
MCAHLLCVRFMKPEYELICSNKQLSTWHMAPSLPVDISTLGRLKPAGSRHTLDETSKCNHESSSASGLVASLSNTIYGR